jgi:hypothetical protein
MRDPNRIRPFLNTLEKLWVLNPDLRFHQLVCWISGDQDQFNTEDDQTKKNIETLIKELK